MTPEAQDAVMQEMLDQSLLYRRNAALGRNVPEQPARNVIRERDVPQRAEQPVVPQLVSEVRETKSDLRTLVTTGILSALGALGATGAAAGLAGTMGIIGYSLANSGDAPAQPGEPPAVVVEEPPATGSLLEYLRDEGYNLPPTGGAQ